MHALGFAHEQTRGDRDNFVTVHTQNVKSGFAGIFRKIPSRFWIDSGHPFEIESVMMYGHNFFSSNGRSTITLKDGRTYPKAGL